MKRFLTSFLFFYLLLLFTPALALRAKEPPPLSHDTAPASHYLVRDHQTGELLKLTPLDYIKGVVAAEMPASYHEEALKAQAVASHSYALYRIREHITAGADGAYLSTDPASCQAYLSEEGRRKFWGDSFAEYEQKLTEAVESVIDTVITSGGEPVMAVFHALSGGKTEAAADIFGSKVNYLVSKESASDEHSPDFLSEKTFSAEEIKKALDPLLHTPLSGDPCTWFGEPGRTAAGSVRDIPVGEQSLTGAQIREALALPSANFSLSYKGNTFTVQTRGKGHGVGMSQYGADFLARQGQTYEQILLHYYTGVALETL